jgi:hypothetical protein
MMMTRIPEYLQGGKTWEIYELWRYFTGKKVAIQFSVASEHSTLDFPWQGLVDQLHKNVLKPPHGLKACKSES